jgi:hypothetical protein
VENEPSEGSAAQGAASVGLVGVGVAAAVLGLLAVLDRDVAIVFGPPLALGAQGLHLGWTPIAANVLRGRGRPGTARGVLGAGLALGIGGLAGFAGLAVWFFSGFHVP